jgi:hypothetical protein
MPSCMFCRRTLDASQEEVHTADRWDGGTDYACDPCLDRITKHTVIAPNYELLRCPECGAAWGSGCDCPDNLRAITAGERAKARAEGD